MTPARECDDRTPLMAGREGIQQENGEITKDSKREEEERLRGARLVLAIGFPYLGLLLVAMDVTLVSTLSATMASTFSSLALVSWLGSAYLIASAAVQPLCGKLTNIYGRRFGLSIALFLFAVGNVICGVTECATVLILGRVIAGVGGGAMNCITAFIATDLVPLQQRTIWSGIADVLWALGIGLGGVVGGLVNDWVGWRWAFLGAAPLTLIVAIGSNLPIGVPEHKSKAESGDEPERIDFLGAILLTGAVVSLTTSLNIAAEGNMTLSPWLLVIAAVLFVLFVIVENSPSTPDPLMPVHLMLDRGVSMTCISGFLIAASMHSLLYYIPFMIQVRGYTASEVGVQMLGELIGASSGPLATGVIINVVGGYRLMKPVVFLIFLIAPLGVFLGTLDTPTWVTFLLLIIMGAGFGSVLTVLLIALLAIVDRRVHATTTSMMYALRQIGAATGLGISGIIMNMSVSSNDNTSPTLDNVAEVCDRHRHFDSNRPAVCVMYGNALHQVFLFATIMAVLGLICSFLVPTRTLRRKTDEDEQS